MISLLIYFVLFADLDWTKLWITEILRSLLQTDLNRVYTEPRKEKRHEIWSRSKAITFLWITLDTENTHIFIYVKNTFLCCIFPYTRAQYGNNKN